MVNVIPLLGSNLTKCLRNFDGSGEVDGRCPVFIYIYIYIYIYVTIFLIVNDESSSDDDVDEWKNYIITDLLSTLCIYLNNIMY